MQKKYLSKKKSVKKNLFYVIMIVISLIATLNNSFGMTCSHWCECSHCFMFKCFIIIEKLIFDLVGGPCLPPTAHKSLDALELLFPLDKEPTLVLYQSLVKIASFHHV